MPARIAEEAAQQADTASLVCKATVASVDASNEPSMPPDPGLVVARVDAVFKARTRVIWPVRRSSSRSPRRARHRRSGSKRSSYTTDWVCGKQIAVREIARHEATAVLQSLLDKMLDGEDKYGPTVVPGWDSASYSY